MKYYNLLTEVLNSGAELYNQPQTRFLTFFASGAEHIVYKSQIIDSNTNHVINDYQFQSIENSSPCSLLKKIVADERTRLAPFDLVYEVV